MKILFTSFSILPNRGAAGFVTESLAANFSRDEMCVVGEQAIGLGRIKRDSDRPRYYYLRSDLSWKGKGKRFFASLSLVNIPVCPFSDVAHSPQRAMRLRSGHLSGYLLSVRLLFDREMDRPAV